MFNEFRITVQEKLSSIPNLSCGIILADDLIQEGKYYFGYKIIRTGNGYNLDYSNTSEYITVTGYLSTKGGSLSTLDNFTEQIVEKLKELRLICTATDMDTFESKVRKVMITGTVKYDNIDNLLK